MRANKPITGRKCYDHLGGRLGALLLRALLNKQWIVLDEGKTTVYKVTDTGQEMLQKLGLQPEEGEEWI